MLHKLDKNDPSVKLISSLRKNYPCEPEIDRILTRKMKRRNGCGYITQTLESMVRNLDTLLRNELEGDFEITNPRWLSGGASKVQMAFSLTWRRPGVGKETTPMVVRMEPAESLVETSRLREAEVMKAFENIVPVPKIYWVDALGKYFPYPALIAEFVSGVTKPSDATSKTTGMGTFMPPQWREKLGPQFAACLGTIHSRDIASAGMSSFIIPEPGTESVELTLNHWSRVWEEDAEEEFPLVSIARAWLQENMPVCEKPVILHCDYRVGNFLFEEENAKISAILDWELARIGDHHQDLAWVSSPSYGHYAEDGKTFLVGGLLSESEFFDRYMEISGLSIKNIALLSGFYRFYAGCNGRWNRLSCRY